jgi:hypothetical protein
MIRDLQERTSNATLTLRSTKTGESYGVTVSSQGKFSFAGSTLPVGSYEVEFPAQTGLRVSSLEATGATISGHTIEIPASQPVNLIVHAAEANCTLSGFALKNGKPVAGAMVLLVPQDPGHDMSLYHRDQSDSDGSFTMSPLFPAATRSSPSKTAGTSSGPIPPSSFITSPLASPSPSALAPPSPSTPKCSNPSPLFLAGRYPSLDKALRVILTSSFYVIH